MHTADDTPSKTGVTRTGRFTCEGDGVPVQQASDVSLLLHCVL